MPGVAEDAFESEKATRAGEAFTDVSEVIVIATGPSALSAVSTATPEGCWRNRERKLSESSVWSICAWFTSDVVSADTGALL
ncbi:hypothetical protein ACFPRL_02205 [Pseudoclavibacter helvolus]